MQHPPDPTGSCRNFPLERTSFIGREHEILELVDLVRRQRLITLLGVGGTGKTRLAIRVAANGARFFAEGAVFVDLAGLKDPSLVVRTVAASMNTTVAGGTDSRNTTEEGLARRMDERAVLIVLDNCEHVREACSRLIDALLRVAPSVSFLTTTREVLGVPGEHLYRVAPLSLPSSDDPDMMLRADAVRLFLERATTGGRSPIVSHDDVRVVAAISVCVDGIPLAVELAAARTRHLTLPQILERLNQRFRLLTFGDSLASRQHTLAATMDWSYELLTERERILLQRVSVFVGGFTLEAAERVCSGADLEEQDILDVLGSLVDKSLVVFEELRACPRYRLLETVREYADAKLSADDREGVRDRHRDWFAAYAERVAPDMGRDAHILHHRPRVRDAEVPLEIDVENCRAALERSLAKGRSDLAMTLVARLWRTWLRLGRREDAREWLRRSLAAAPAELNETRLAALLGLAANYIELGDFAAAFERAAEAKGLAIAIGAHTAVPVALHHQAIAAIVTGDADPDVLFTEAFECAERLGDRAAAADALKELGERRIVQGQYPEAEELLARAIQRIGDDPDDELTRAHYLTSLCLATHLAGDDQRAVVLGEKALAHARNAAQRGSGTTAAEATDGSDWGRGLVYAAPVLGIALAAVGEVDRAYHLIKEGMRQVEEFRVPLNDADCLVAFAAAATLEGNAPRAARLLGAARALMARNGAWRRQTGGAMYSHYVRRVRNLLPADIAEREREAGRAMTREVAIAFALDVDGSRSTASRRGIRDGLTPSVASSNVFRFEGDVWMITYAGHTVRVRDARGLRYLAMLLREPGREFHVSDVIRAVQGEATVERGAFDDGNIGTRRDIGGPHPPLDARAYKEYRTRYADLCVELDQAQDAHDIGRAAMLTDELEALREQLAAAVRTGRGSSSAERARTTVTKGIKRALETIGRVHPSLGQHLAVTIRRGYFCVYAPDPRHPIEWLG